MKQTGPAACSIDRCDGGAALCAQNAWFSLPSAQGCGWNRIHKAAVVSLKHSAVDSRSSCSRKRLKKGGRLTRRPGSRTPARVAPSCGAIHHKTSGHRMRPGSGVRAAQQSVESSLKPTFPALHACSLFTPSSDCRDERAAAERKQPRRPTAAV